MYMNLHNKSAAKCPILIAALLDPWKFTWVSVYLTTNIISLFYHYIYYTTIYIPLRLYSSSCPIKGHHLYIKYMLKNCLSYTSSSSTNVPLQSLGCRNTTGFPWAPILGSSLSSRMFLAFKSAIAALMLSTCYITKQKCFLQYIIKRFSTFSK